MQQAPDAVSTTRRTAVDRALLQVDDEPLMARSGAGMGVATPNTVPQRSALPANIVPARAPVSTSNQTTRNSAVHGNQVPARGRGIRRRPGNGPRQSAVGRRTQVDSEATLIPRPTRQPTAMTPTSGLSSAPTSSRRQFQPPPAPQVSDAYQLDRAEADMVRNGIAPWPYDPRTGAKTGNTSEYSYSTRDFRMLGNGIPPWPYDPKTGEKTKLSTGWKGYRVGSASKN